LNSCIRGKVEVEVKAEVEGGFRTRGQGDGETRGK